MWSDRPMKLAVAGATGMVGKHVVAEAQARGYDVVPLARATGVDVMDAEGLARHLHGVDAVVDCLNIQTQSDRKATRFFTSTSNNLLQAGERAGVGHHVLLSIVGLERAPIGYYRAKIAQESVVRASGRPATILRATQFHEFPGQLIDRTRVGPVTPIPRMLSATVAAREVGAALVDLAFAPPQSSTVELAGPATHQMPDLARRVARKNGLRTKILPVKLPGRAGTAMSTGALVPVAPWRVGVQTFEEWLDA